MDAAEFCVERFVSNRDALLPGVISLYDSIPSYLEQELIPIVKDVKEECKENKVFGQVADGGDEEVFIEMELSGSVDRGLNYDGEERYFEGEERVLNYI